ncbi:hypothetical protein [Georgenia ruanii]|uniref:hypothetical protein n=1 Tax=Georgenia ruanii TaxID=348442 RepID=UPI0012643F60|nr:hypothetical protein [Georgenia ruanii]
MSDLDKLVLNTVNEYATAVRDHLEALALLAESGAPFRPILALCRVLLDAAAHARLLMDAEITDLLRKSRVVNLKLRAIREEIMDPHPPGGESTRQRLVRQREQLMALAIQGGCTQAVTKRGEPDWAVEPRLAHNEAIHALLGPWGEQPWRYLSSVAHIQERSMIRFALGMEGIAPGPHAGAQAAVQAFPAILVCVEAVVAAQTFFGVAGQRIPDRLPDQVRAVWAAAAGLRDDVLRVRLGFDS